MLRGVRLVVDSGMHALKWSREQAVRYYADAGRSGKRGHHRGRALLRLAGPGLQLHAGQAGIPEAARRAQKALGGKFDIRKFHDAMLLDGAVPLMLDADWPTATSPQAEGAMTIIPGRQQAHPGKPLRCS